MTEQAIATSPAGAARMLGLGRTKIAEMISKGQLQSIKIGRRRLVLVESIKALIASYSHD